MENKVLQLLRGLPIEKSSKPVHTENGAVSNATTGNIFLDDFAACGSYRDREMKDVFDTMDKLWAANPELTVRMTFFIRMITRKVKGFHSTELVQRGQGNKNESYMRFLWLVLKQPKVFYNNLFLIPLVGSWKDLWEILTLAELKEHSLEVNIDKFFELMLAGINESSMKALVVKYMPQIKAASKCTTPRAKIRNKLAKKFATYLKMTFIDYRHFKSTNGEGHRWQQFISNKQYAEIDFNKIPGKALSLLVSGKFLQNHRLEKLYTDWLTKQPAIKYNGFPYELLHAYMKGRNSMLQKRTIDKQFEYLLNTARQDNGSITGNVWCALDTSSSMKMTIANNSDVTSFDVCISLGVYFSMLNTGTFKDYVVMFDSYSKTKVLQGAFTERIDAIKKSATAWGGTNFQSIIDMIVRIRKNHPEIPVEDYPETLLVISDMQFNSVGTVDSNYTAAMKKLDTVGLPPIKIIWWRVNARKLDMPSTVEDYGTYFFSGFDGAIIKFLLGKDTNVEEVESASKNMLEVMSAA